MLPTFSKFTENLYIVNLMKINTSELFPIILLLLKCFLVVAVTAVFWIANNFCFLVII